MVGVVISLSAALLRAMRAWVQGNLLRGQDKIDSITLLFYAAPFNLALFLLGSAMLEGAAPWTEYPDLPWAGKAWIYAAAVAASLYNLFAFLLV